MRNRVRKYFAAAVFCMAILLSMLGTAGAAPAAPSLTILMYHNLTEDPNAITSMTIAVDRFRQDMEFLQEFGYTALLPSDLVAISQGKQQLPDKAVMITFDDGYRSNYTYAYPILQQTGMKAVIAVVAHNICHESEVNPTGHSLTWEELSEMVSSGIVEVGSHTYNLHNPQHNGNSAPDGINGIMRLRGETESAYRTRVGTDLQTSIQLIKQNTGQQNVFYFAYPYGAYDYWMPALLRENGILVSVLSNAGQAHPTSSLLSMPRYGIRMEKSVSTLLQQSATATPTTANVSVNGTAVSLPAYNINGNNYVRVRDVAFLLKDTANGFDVQWDDSLQQVSLTSQTPYTPIGTENKPLASGQKSVRSIVEPTAANGTLHMVAAYNIDDYTYYKLRSLGDLCGFTVDWDETTQTVEVTA